MFNAAKGFFESMPTERAIVKPSRVASFSASLHRGAQNRWLCEICLAASSAAQYHPPHYGIMPEKGDV